MTVAVDIEHLFQDCHEFPLTFGEITQPTFRQGLSSFFQHPAHRLVRQTFHVGQPHAALGCRRSI